MPTEPEPVMLSDVVQKAVEACDDGGTPQLEELLAKFEDDDEPISAIPDVEERLELRLGPSDDEAPQARMARALIVYLAYRRDQFADDPQRLLRLAARAEFDGHPPPEVERWLVQRGAL